MNRTDRIPAIVELTVRWRQTTSKYTRSDAPLRAMSVRVWALQKAIE